MQSREALIKSRAVATKHRSPGYDLRRIPRDHHHLISNAIRGGFNQRFPRSSGQFDATQWRSLAPYALVIVVLHLAGWAICLAYAATYPALFGLGLAAYLFGLRHAFDADHIAAIDDTVRFLLQKGRMPVGVGFFFSLGHSTVVLVLAILVALVANQVTHYLPGLQNFGQVAGSLVSGLFLWLIGFLNLAVLLDMLHVWRYRHVGHDHHHWQNLLARRGLVRRLFGQRLFRVIEHSWQMYPVGLLFGLGFDTASEIAMLSLAGSAAVTRMPTLAVLSLPVLFAAGMSLMDTADGLVMTRAYGWAMFNPVRQVFYNLASTFLSVSVALLIGSLELGQLVVGLFHLHGVWPDRIAAWSVDRLGYVIVVLFVVVWLGSFLVWRRHAAADHAAGHLPD